MSDVVGLGRSSGGWDDKGVYVGCGWVFCVAGNAVERAWNCLLLIFGAGL